jgi:hypothetical protein
MLVGIWWMQGAQAATGSTSHSVEAAKGLDGRPIPLQEGELSRLDARLADLLPPEDDEDEQELKARDPHQASAQRTNGAGSSRPQPPGSGSGPRPQQRGSGPQLQVQQQQQPPGWPRVPPAWPPPASTAPPGPAQPPQPPAWAQRQATMGAVAGSGGIVAGGPVGGGPWRGYEDAAQRGTAWAPLPPAPPQPQPQPPHWRPQPGFSAQPQPPQASHGYPVPPWAAPVAIRTSWPAQGPSAPGPAPYAPHAAAPQQPYAAAPRPPPAAYTVMEPDDSSQEGAGPAGAAGRGGAGPAWHTGSDGVEELDLDPTQVRRLRAEPQDSAWQSKLCSFCSPVRARASLASRVAALSAPLPLPPKEPHGLRRREGEPWGARGGAGGGGGVSWGGKEPEQAVHRGPAMAMPPAFRAVQAWCPAPAAAAGPRQAGRCGAVPPPSHPSATPRPPLGHPSPTALSSGLGDALQVCRREVGHTADTRSPDGTRDLLPSGLPT